MSKNKNKLPDRWQQYSPLGNVVHGTRFLPFKTPLKESICRKNLPYEEDWFTPAMLHERAPMVKVVIDLTFTHRYYNPMDFLNFGVYHVKIKCPGGGQQLPHPELLNTFNKAVQSFMQSEDGRNPETLIGVHCTHGLNRTGYFICNYMVQFCKFAPQVAFEAFEAARGYQIERNIYKTDIMRRDAINRSKKYDAPRFFNRTFVSNFGPSYQSSAVGGSSHSNYNMNDMERGPNMGHRNRNPNRRRRRKEHSDTTANK